jgi:hypothetical protein
MTDLERLGFAVIGFMVAMIGVWIVACTLAAWVDALGRRDRGEFGFHRCRDPEGHRDDLQPSPSRQPSPDPGRRRAMEQLKIGETVVRRGSVSGRRGDVVRVTEDGFLVTVKGPSWLGLDAYESTHRAS